MLGGDTAVIAETEDSWFSCQKLHLPAHCGYEFQMQYGSIGWSVGQSQRLEYRPSDHYSEKNVAIPSHFAKGSSVSRKRPMLDCPNILSQVTAQDISMMIGCGQRSIIFLIDNGGYTIDVEIHDGPYNVIIKKWNYAGLVDATLWGWMLFTMGKADVGLPSYADCYSN
ncbi:hypothetical protein Vadar_012894 [Vaccinium darrowii]|uniref:Uncharacterized protein n=1 Tax=Vaccinium darrowii TaxID=229202 RepID=A0ACB7YFG2_9ERIC|nr:hypothetical protein Vadar_012894 [Vaccinium darrowii]